MSKPVRRQGSAVYYARRVIPQDLREAYGKREIWKSLGVTDLEAAKPLERKQQLVWEGELETVPDQGTKQHRYNVREVHRPCLRVA